MRVGKRDALRPRRQRALAGRDSRHGVFTPGAIRLALAEKRGILPEAGGRAGLTQGDAGSAAY